jgi:hypothetical protein
MMFSTSKEWKKHTYLHGCVNVERTFRRREQSRAVEDTTLTDLDRTCCNFAEL